MATEYVTLKLRKDAADLLAEVQELVLRRGVDKLGKAGAGLSRAGKNDVLVAALRELKQRLTK